MNAEIDISDVTLKTERLILRPWSPSDLEDLYEYASVDGVGQMAGWLPHKNREESQAILDLFIAGKKTFAIEYQGKVIGSLGIEKYDEKELPEFQNQAGREIGYALSKAYWGQEIMPEAAKRVIGYLLEDVGLDFIVCSHSIDNTQSKRVQEKCGFKHYKQFRYETQYGAVRDSWLSLLFRE